MTKTAANATNSPGTPATVRSLRRNKEAFYSTVWPALEEEGWTKIDASESMSGKPIFVPKVMQLKVGQKGEDFYDDEEAVITRLLERRTTKESTIVDSYLANVGTNANPQAEAVAVKSVSHGQRLDLHLDGDDKKSSDQDAGPSLNTTAAEPENEEPKLDTSAEDNSGHPVEDMEVDSSSHAMEKTGQVEEQDHSESASEATASAGLVATASSAGQLATASNAGLVATTTDVGAIATVDVGLEGQLAETKGSTAMNIDEPFGDDTIPPENDIAAAGEQITEHDVEKGPAKDTKSETVPRVAEEDGIHYSGQKTPETSGVVSEQGEGKQAQAGSITRSKETVAATAGSAKKERQRPKRSTSKSKGEKPALTVGIKEAGGVDYIEGKGKGSYDASDRDGSDYQSSDESQQGRKRKRRAASTTPTGGGRARSRPRGRPRRKTKGAASPKRAGGTSPRPRGRKPRQAPTALLDLSWKNGGKNFPKKVSQVGPEYNATKIEPAGSWKDNESDIYCEQIWDPKVAEQKLEGESKDFLAARNVPHNKREGAMIGLAEVGYDASKFEEDKVVDNVTTRDGTEWTEEERKRYHTEIFRLRKNIREVSKVTGKSINSCFAYYLGTFKKSDDYRLLKSVCYQERLRRLMEAEHDLDACAICGDGGNLLICDGCEGEYHMECCRPALKIIPEGKWECDECVDRAFVTAKDSLMRNNNLFQRLQQPNGDGGEPSKEANNNATAEGNGSLRVRPTSPVLDIISKLAQNISAAFTEGGLSGE